MCRVEGKNVMLTPDYIVGLTEGEGCFLVCLRKDNRIELRFFIAQAIGNKPLLKQVKEFFKVGSVYQKSNVSGKLPAYAFEVAKRDDIFQVVIPFFRKNKLRGYKAKSFSTFAEIAKIVKGRQDKRKLTKEELEYVTKIRSGMNKHYGSPGAGKPLAGWERAITSMKHNPSS
ncbi:LAGLIDADG family homing endonuclease [Patescibacteria group bacterium]